MKKYPEYRHLGDQVLVVQFEDEVSIHVNRKVRTLAKLIEQLKVKGVTELIPTFTSLAVCYNPLLTSYSLLVGSLEQLNSDSLDNVDQASRTIYIPVVYGDKYGPDVEEIAQQKQLSPEEIIRIHHEKPYLVYMAGFIASFPYCGDVDERLILPRRSNPRLKVPKGSVCIANKQTGIYTTDSPGGWHLLGWTPMETFSPAHSPPSLLVAGDYVKFEPIQASVAEEWDEQRQREWDNKWNTFKS